jgi:thiol-disulfide isomerase/thioredoxin
MKKQICIFFAILLALSTCVALAETDVKEAVCPVCRVHEGESEAETVEASADYDGNTYGFCSEKCKDTFAEAPDSYLPPVFPRPAPLFVVRDLTGTDFSSQELHGRVVLLDFWATWCQPCITDMPKLTALHERHSGSGLTVVSVSTDEGDDAAKKVAKIVKKTKATHPIYLDSTDSPAWSDYLVRVVPTQFLIDAAGNVVAQWSGKIDLEIVEAEITRLLAAAE